MRKEGLLLSVSNHLLGQGITAADTQPQRLDSLQFDGSPVQEGLDAVSERPLGADFFAVQNCRPFWIAYSLWHPGPWGRHVPTGWIQSNWRGSRIRSSHLGASLHLMGESRPITLIERGIGHLFATALPLTIISWRNEKHYPSPMMEEIPLISVGNNYLFGSGSKRPVTPVCHPIVDRRFRTDWSSRVGSCTPEVQ